MSRAVGVSGGNGGGRRSKTKQYIGQIQYLAEKHGRISLGKLAFYLDVSLKHLRYSILPVVLDNSDCLELDRKRKELVFTCSTDPEEEARREVVDEFARLGVAVDG